MVNVPARPSQQDKSQLTEEIVRALQKVGGFGSVEIFVQNNIVTQITVRNIKKTSVAVSRELPENKNDIPLNVQFTT
jgi:hypothetical protein